MIDIELFKINPQIDGAEEKDCIFFTPNAVQEIQRNIADNAVPDGYYLRIKSRLGENEGVNFIMEYEPIVNDNDRFYELENIKFVIDNISLFFLLGITVDFVYTETMSGFIFKNLKYS